MTILTSSLQSVEASESISVAALQRTEEGIAAPSAPLVSARSRPTLRFTVICSSFSVFEFCCAKNDAKVLKNHKNRENCKARKSSTLKNEALVAKIGFDTLEDQLGNEK
jgi:hypothetical protein